MGLKKFKPTSPGTRQLVITDRSDLWKGKPEKTLTEGLSKTGGRNNRINSKRPAEPNVGSDVSQISGTLKAIRKQRG